MEPDFIYVLIIQIINQYDKVFLNNMHMPINIKSHKYKLSMSYSFTGWLGFRK